MEREKQIEEMAKLICNDTRCKTCIHHVEIEDCNATKISKRLYNADYRKVEQEWISVEDRLPSESIKCLVYTKRGGIFLTHYFYKNANTIGFEFWDVTHWMPLPTPPKMKGAE